jgi:hypothetical protein
MVIVADGTAGYRPHMLLRIGVRRSYRESQDLKAGIRL